MLTNLLTSGGGCAILKTKGGKKNGNQEQGDRVRIFSPDEGSPVEASKKGDSKAKW